MAWGVQGNIRGPQGSQGFQGNQGVQGATGATGIPAGLIAIWSGPSLTIPEGWVLCDGNNGTPDLRDKFVIGAQALNVGFQGGATTHQHAEALTTEGGAHTHASDGGHQHDSVAGHQHTGVNHYHSTGTLTMPAWQGEPVVTAHVMDLYAYLSARADGRQGPGRP